MRDEQDVKPEFKVTLKYRGPDRYLSAAQDVSVSQGTRDAIEDEGGEAEVDLKFEQDILPPFVAKFAHSVSIKTRNRPPLDRISQERDIFPGLAGLDLPGSARLQTVNGFYAHEVAHWLGKFRFKKKPTIKACLSFWSLSAESKLPLIAEFSYDYDLRNKDALGQNELERFQTHAAQGALDLFEVLQKQAAWVNLAATTKTAYAYQGF
jgi:hypothetical protein